MTITISREQRRDSIVGPSQVVGDGRATRHKGPEKRPYLLHSTPHFRFIPPFHSKMAPPPKRTILGQDPEVLLALWANVLSWFVSTFAPSLLPRLLPTACAEEDDSASTSSTATNRTRCISIGRPGGSEQLRLVTLRPSVVTVGYNLSDRFCKPPYTPPISSDDIIPEDCVILENEAFSVNYADVCIRWGLYESAKRFVGYPIVPGFDVAGRVAKVGSKVTTLKPGDRVFGCTLFGAYSSRVLIPAMQLNRTRDGKNRGSARTYTKWKISGQDCY